MNDRYGYSKGDDVQEFDQDGYPMSDNDQPVSDDRVTAGNEVGELSIDLIDQGDSFVILSFIAGVSKHDLDIELSRQSVYLHGERLMPNDISPTQTFTQELYWGQFERTINLPDEVDIDRAFASEEHGLLVLTLPKVDKHRKASVKVKRAGEA